MKLLFSFLALLWAAPLALAQLAPAERRALEETLFIGNLTLDDLRFDKKDYTDRYTLPLVQRSLDDPLVALEELMRLHEAAPGVNVAQVLRRLGREVLVGRASQALEPVEVPQAGRVPAAIPAEIRLLVEQLASAVVRANGAVRQALVELSPEEQRAVIESLPHWAASHREVDFGFTTAQNIGSTELHRHLDQVKLDVLIEGAAQLAAAVESALPALRSAARTARFEGKHKFMLYGITVVVAGVGNDLHDDRDAVLTLDLGGNDRYTGRHGAGAGYAALSIDLGGDDIYHVPDLSVGAAVLGIGLAYDIGGHDVFRGRSITFGSGLAGVGVLVKEGGHDVYEGIALTQGFGQFGIGLLVDTAGDDRYSARLFGQGAARTRGVGWLVDHRGNDFYRCGWLVPALPLFPEAFLSLGQGYGGGYPEDQPTAAGGIGLLTDLAGDDTYTAGAYAQAASDWLAVGSLYDREGDDTYAAHHGSQASARSGSGAFLFDLSGSDLYSVRVGASQGTGHDRSVALLLDRSGDDVYSSHDGLAAAGSGNGLGILIDGGGSDRFPSNAGVGHPAGGLPSLGVFVSLGTPGSIGGGVGRGFGARRGAVGVAASFAEPKAAEQPAPATAAPEPGSEPLPLLHELDRLYREAALGSLEAERRLIAIGQPVLEWVVDRRLAAAGPRERRVMSSVVRAVGPQAALVIGPKTASEEIDEARNALLVLLEADISEAALYAAPALNRPELRRLGARAAKKMPNMDLVPELMLMAGSEQGLDSAAALRALAAIGDPRSFSTGEALLGAQDLLARHAAMQLVAAFPEPALLAAERLLLDQDERRARIAIELLAMLDTEQSLAKIAPMLLDTRAGVRLEAAIALDGRVPHSHREAFAALLRDPVPLVRLVAAGLDPGR
jgi:hypothetical protein